MKQEHQQATFMNRFNTFKRNNIESKQHPLKQFMRQRSLIKNLVEFDKPKIDRSDRVSEDNLSISKNLNTRSQHFIINNRSKRDHSPVPSINSFQDQRFKEVEQLLTRENFNLKEHRDFLINQVKKYGHVIKKYKSKLKQTERRVEQLQHQNDVYRLQYMQMRKYVFEGMHKMEEIVEDNKQSPISDQKNLLCQVNNESSNTTQFKNWEGDVQPQEIHYPIKIEKVSDFSRSKKQNFGSFEPFVSNQIALQTQNRYQIKRNGSRISLEQQQNKLRELNFKFEGLMRQYSKTKDHNVIKRCRDISKQIKNVKNSLNSSRVNTPYSRQQNPEQSFNLYDNPQLEKQNSNHDTDELHINFSNMQNLRNTQRTQYVTNNNQFQVNKYKQIYRPSCKSQYQKPAQIYQNKQIYRVPSGGLTQDGMHTKRLQANSNLNRIHRTFNTDLFI